MQQTSWFFGRRGQNFVDQFASLLPGRTDRPSPFKAVEHKIVICCTSRTGSTLLCQRLLPYGLAAQEFFNAPRIETEKRVSGATDYSELCAHLVREYVPANAFGLKGNFQSLVPLFLIGELPANLASWRFVHLTRTNLLRQAISMVIAKKRQAYASWQTPVRTLEEKDYSGNEIAGTIENISMANAWWENFFAVFGIDPLRITYEQMSADPAGTTQRVSDYCDLALCDPAQMRKFEQEALQPQSTALNAQWEKKFLRDARSMRLS